MYIYIEDMWWCFDSGRCYVMMTQHSYELYGERCSSPVQLC